jgi:hypothetical protein
MKIRAVLLAVFATALAITMPLHAGTRANPNGPYDFSHSVPVSPGRAVLQPGDKIVIDAIHGSADSIAEGNVYQIDGRYTLSSKDAASLGVFVSPDTGQHPAVKNNSISITRGDGTFTVFVYVWHKGDPFISLYSDGKADNSFGAVYFNGIDPWAKKS